jgi:cytochrome c oxidase assembly protein subunit 15
MSDLWLHRFYILLAVLTLFLIVAGASVTSNEAGLSVPDWPLSYGKVMPEMTGGVFYEHGHRMVGAAVGLLTIVLAAWLQLRDERRWMRRLGWIALAAVIVQGVLGGLTVLLLLPKAVSIAHACLAQLFFTLTVAIALFTSRAWKQGPEIVEDHGSPSLRTMAVLTAVATLGQIALGAAYRHRAFGLTPHVIAAFVVLALALLAAMFTLQQFPRHRHLRPAAVAVLVIVMAQVLLGIAAYVSRIYTSESPQPLAVMVFFTVLHVAGGALAMAASGIFAVQIARHVRRPLAAVGREVSVVS